jgi:cytochrome P450
MLLSLFPLVLLSLSTIIFYYLYQKRLQRPPTGLRNAPGPSGALPIIGHAHQLTNPPHRQIQTWASQYGEIYKVRLGWYDWYMLCSPSAVKDILDKQSANTSSRAPLPVASDALSGGLRFLFMPYGSMWRRMRGVSHKLLTPVVSATFKPSQEWEGKMLLEEVLRESDSEKEGGKERGGEGAYKAVRRYTVSVIMTSTYGRRIPEWVSKTYFYFRSWRGLGEIGWKLTRVGMR